MSNHSVGYIDVAGESKLMQLELEEALRKIESLEAALEAARDRVPPTQLSSAEKISGNQSQDLAGVSGKVMKDSQLDALYEAAKVAISILTDKGADPRDATIFLQQAVALAERK